MMKQILLLMSFFLLLTNSALSFQVDSSALKEGLKDVKLDKNHMRQMLDLLVSQGKITPQQGEEAKKELSDLSQEEMDNLTTKAIKHINSKASEDSSSLDDYLEGVGN